MVRRRFVRLSGNWLRASSASNDNFPDRMRRDRKFGRRELANAKRAIIGWLESGQMLPLIIHRQPAIQKLADFDPRTSIGPAMKARRDG